MQQNQRYIMTGNSTMDVLASNNGSVDYIKFFKKGLKYAAPSEKNQFQGRILPAHDLSLDPNSQEFATAFIPYRVCKMSEVKDPTDLDSARGVPRTTNWFIGMAGYKMFGRMGADILSPSTKRAYPALNATKEDMADPLADIFWLAKKNPAYEPLTKDGTGKKAPTVPKARTFAIFNVLTRKDPTKPLEPQLMLLPKAGLDCILAKLAWPTVYGSQPRDVNWPEFLYGDITHPTTGLWFNACMEQVGTFTTNTLCFSSQLNSLMGSSVFSVEPAVLAQRKVLDHNLFEWMSYQEIVDLIVEDGTIPYELVSAACSHLANIPPEKKRVQYSVANPAHVNINPAALGSFALPTTAPVQAPVLPTMAPVAAPAIPVMQAPVFNVPTMPAPQLPVMPPVMAAPVVEAKYWFAVIGTQNPPQLLTESQAKSQLTAVGDKARFMAEAGGDWKTPQQMGWGIASPAAPPQMPPAFPSQPVAQTGNIEVLTTDVPFDVPANVQFQNAPAVEEPKVPLGKEYSSSGDMLSDGELAEVKALRSKMQLNAAPPSMEDITRLMALESRARKHGQALA